VLNHFCIVAFALAEQIDPDKAVVFAQPVDASCLYVALNALACPDATYVHDP
jgi:hypothetical protein